MQGNNFDDDIDDIMASIMSGQRPVQPLPQKRKPVSRIRNRPVLHPNNPTPPTPATKVNYIKASPKQPELKKSNGKLVKPILGVFLVVFLVLGGTVLWRGPIASMTKIKNPFSEEISRSIDTKLYYPTKLPSSYKMELNSIAQPEPSVLVYSITDNSGKQINISIQKKPETLTLGPLYEALKNLRQINTKFGTVTTGTSVEGMDITNILADDTWLIITTNQSTLSDEELQLIINNLET